jgi:Fe-S-cluster containining protein
VALAAAPRIACARCGTCCRASASAFVTDADRARWRREGRQDILAVLAHENAVWAGNHLVSSRDGHEVGACPFLATEGVRFACSIYPTRPGVCRDYQPASSAICPLFASKGVA